MRCHYDAGNYQMAVEAFVWKTYEETLPADAVELDIDGSPRRAVLDHEADRLERPLVDHLHDRVQDRATA